MIFVTVGTTHFDDLVREMDRLVAAGEVREEVLAQIGSGRYEPARLQWVRHVPDIRSVYRQASLVVCHGGAGTVFDLLEMGKDFIPVPNRSLQDDHQSDLLRALESRGWCTVCWSPADLAHMFHQQSIRRRCRPEPAALRDAVWEFVQAAGRFGRDGGAEAGSQR